MARITVEDCLEKHSEPVQPRLVVAERTKHLLKGADPLIADDRSNKEVVLALREVAAGMVRADLKDFDENEILRSFAGPLSQEDSAALRGLGSAAGGRRRPAARGRRVAPISPRA
jgi:DNA-directed RNA polymerase subunit omega